MIGWYYIVNLMNFEIGFVVDNVIFVDNVIMVIDERGLYG